MGERIAVATDTNSGITLEEAKAWGVSLVSMPFCINDKVYYEGKTLTQETFFAHLAEDMDISTSQPSPGDLLDTWDRLLQSNDAVIYIPMSGGLSSSTQSAKILASDYKGSVYVIDNKRISVTQRQSVLDALYFIKQGYSAEAVQKILEDTALDASIFITVDTLKYLKKGGRITPAAAAVGSVLNIKPVLQIQGDKLDAFKKVRGWKAAKKAMLQALHDEIDGRFAGKKLLLGTAYSGDKETGRAWHETVRAEFPNHEVIGGILPLSIACHTGPGALGLGCMTKLYD